LGQQQAGDTADTGTHPDSAPHMPLNTATRSSAATIFENVVSGVPMKSTPRTSSSRPSGYTRYTITGITLKALGMNRMVRVKPPSMSSNSSPYGLFSRLISSISMRLSSACECGSAVSTTRFDWRATGLWPSWARPCPLELANPSMGERAMRKVFKMPCSTTATRRAFTPSSSYR